MAQSVATVGRAAAGVGVAGAEVAFGAGVALVALGFGVTAGAVTAWETAGAAAGAFAEPHAARLRPAASVMAGIPASSFFMMISLPGQ